MDPALAAEINDIRLAQQMRWTLDYVRGLSQWDKATIWGVIDADNKLSDLAQKRAAKASKR